ncbi:hypothetical protein KSP39_PZI022293 [Platanthera zijinensis]|uniref:Uncharacterized protein n=1 Tax=Platanthera zijinensis TaxID=2320716 RepID=A0AAP0FUC9_9ASPA
MYVRRQDSSIGFGAPVRANMKIGGLTNAAVTSSLLESFLKNDEFTFSQGLKLWLKQQEEVLPLLEEFQNEDSDLAEEEDESLNLEFFNQPTEPTEE